MDHDATRTVVTPKNIYNSKTGSIYFLGICKFNSVIVVINVTDNSRLDAN